MLIIVSAVVFIAGVLFYIFLVLLLREEIGDKEEERGGKR